MMTREEAIEQLKGLHAEREGSQLYLPVGEQPEVVWWEDDLHCVRVAYVTDGRWRVEWLWVHGDVGHIELGSALRSTLAECVEWLATRGC